MSDQKAMWNANRTARMHEELVGKPQQFAVQAALSIKPGMKLPELGCGVGSDAVYFASLGADVTATDFSDAVIQQDKARGTRPNLTFEDLDIVQPSPYEAGMFDIVYTHLSLHYFNEELTDRIFKEIARVLKAGGTLCFSCKPVHDPLYGEGQEVQPGVFDRNGHICHSFSLEYAGRLLATDYEEIKLDEVEGVYDDHPSAFIQCSARKRGM